MAPGFEGGNGKVIALARNEMMSFKIKHLCFSTT
jgi:hypothetical protein